MNMMEFQAERAAVGMAADRTCSDFPQRSGRTDFDQFNNVKRRDGSNNT